MTDCNFMAIKMLMEGWLDCIDLQRDNDNLSAAVWGDIYFP